MSKRTLLFVFCIFWFLTLLGGSIYFTDVIAMHHVRPGHIAAPISLFYSGMICGGFFAGIVIDDA